MPISANASQFEIKMGEKISRGTLAYIRSRVQQWAHSVLLKEFKASGINQAELCRRLDKAPEVISRLLARPSNVELDTLSTAIFALRGGILRFSIAPAKLSGVPETGDITRILVEPIKLAPNPDADYIKPQLEPAKIENWAA